MAVKLGKPTEYGYVLPILRYDLCKKYFITMKTKHRLLDYGCGNGANTIKFKDDFNDVLGIDVEKERVGFAKKYIEDNKVKHVKYEIYDGKKIPNKNNWFNFIVSFEVLEHVENDEESIKELYRVLKPEGILAITVPNKWYLMETHGFNLPLNNIIPYNRIPFLNLMPKCFYSRYGNARIYTCGEIVRKLSKNNFELLTYQYIKPTFDKVNNLFIRKLLKYFFNIFPDFMGSSIFVVAMKKSRKL